MPSRILIYLPDGNPAGDKIQRRLRRQGHIAARRNPQFYHGEIENCDAVITHSIYTEVVAAYTAAGTRVSTLDITVKAATEKYVEIDIALEAEVALRSEEFLNQPRAAMSRAGQKQLAQMKKTKPTTKKPSSKKPAKRK
jgi:hypothetical protein